MDTSLEEPQTREHRLVMRVLAQWQAIAGPRGLPRRSQIDPRHFGEDWRNCFLVDVDPKTECSRLAFLGDNLADPSWPAFDRQCLAEFQRDTLLHAATSYIGRVIAKGVPVSSGGVGLHQGVPMVYRSILLPLSEGEGRIDGLLGAVNYREIPVSEEIHPLRAHYASAPRPAAQG
jgi:hypothetical protein